MLHCYLLEDYGKNQALLLLPRVLFEVRVNKCWPSTNQVPGIRQPSKILGLTLLRQKTN